MISHRNLLQNSAFINSVFDLPAEITSVTWLPAFHDMGLTNGIIQPLFKGRTCCLMPPQSFLQRPQYPTVEALARHLTRATDGSSSGNGLDHQQVMESEPIAIIGIGCRFPGSSGPQAFWQSIRDGVDAITEVPPDRFNLTMYTIRIRLSREMVMGC